MTGSHAMKVGFTMLQGSQEYNIRFFPSLLPLTG